MEIYIILLILCLLASVYFRKSKLVGIIVLTTLFLLSAGRGESVGLDTVVYYSNYYSKDFGGDIHAYEFLFIKMCSFIRDSNLNPRSCLYMLSFITFFFIYLASRRYHESLVVICFFYLLFSFYTHSLNISRQMAACSVLLYAYSFLFGETNKDVKIVKIELTGVVCFILLVILATSFHSGAILALVGLPIFFLNTRFFKLFAKTNISPFVMSLLLFVTFAIVQINREIFLSQSQGIFTAVDMYKEYATKETSLSIFGFLLKSIAYFFHGYVLFYLIEKSEVKLFSLFFFGIFIRILLSAFYGVISRFGLFFSIIDVVVYARCFFYLSKKKQMFFYLILIYWGIEYVSILVYNTYDTVPYVFKPIEVLL